MRIGIVFFDGMEELDAVGPWEVLAAWTQRWPQDGAEVIALAPNDEPVECAKGLRVFGDIAWDSAGELDVVVYPGGVGARAQVGDETVRRWVQTQQASGALMTSVCTGALVLADAGLLAGKPATTHWSALDKLRQIDPTIDVRGDERFVDAGDVITSAGISAGIDMALHLVARLHSTERAQEVRRYIQYDPVP